MKISEQIPPAILKIEARPGQPAVAGKSQDNLPFAPGQLVKGTVAGFTGDGKVLLEVGGQLVTARTMVPLTPGSELWLETGQSGSLPLLTLAAKKGAVQDFLKLLISGTPFAAPNSRGVSDLLSALLPGQASQASAGEQVLAGSLIAAASDGEASPAAIKTLTLLLGSTAGSPQEIAELLAAFEQKASGPQPGLEPGTDKLVKILAAHQQINSHPPQANDQNFLLFPCFFAGNSGWGEWLFSLEKQAGKDRGEQYGLSFFLEMSRLGPVALQATISGRAISGQFLLASEKAGAHMADNIQELVQLLGRQGYHPVGFTCRVKREQMISQLKQALQEKAAIQRFSLLDVSV